MKHITATFLFLFVFSMTQTNAQNMHKHLPEAAKIISKQLPIMIDDTTELYAVEVIGDNTLLYKNRLVDGKREEAISQTEFSNIMRPIHINYIHTNPAMMQFIKAGVVYQYGYYFEDGTHYITLEYDQNDFK